MIDFSKTFNIHTSDGTELNIEVGCNKEGGWYEVYDVDTGGDEYYAEGYLEIEEIDNKPTLTGYDGCYELPEWVAKAVEEQGVVLDI